MTDALFLLATLAACAAAIRLAVALEKRSRRQRNTEAVARQRRAYLGMTHRGGPIEPPPERLDVERRTR